MRRSFCSFCGCGFYVLVCLLGSFVEEFGIFSSVLRNLSFQLVSVVFGGATCFWIVFGDFAWFFGGGVIVWFFLTFVEFFGVC